MLACAVLAGTGGVHAATLTVTNTADSGTGSLRQALAEASDGDTIDFDAALNGQTISLTSGELAINRNIAITGPGSSLLAVSRSSSVSRFRVFYVLPSRTVTIAGLTISGGYADATVGGGILNDQAELMISNCTVSGNISDGGDGGGGIYNTGTLTLVDSIVSDNWAGFTSGFPVGRAGGIYTAGKMLTIVRSAIINNTAVFDGGGIVGGPLTIIESTISGNRAGSSFSGSGYGGGILGGNMTITNSTISGNTASGNGSGYGGGIVKAAPRRSATARSAGTLAIWATAASVTEAR